MHGACLAHVDAPMSRHRKVVCMRERRRPAAAMALAAVWAVCAMPGVVLVQWLALVDRW